MLEEMFPELHPSGLARVLGFDNDVVSAVTRVLHFLDSDSEADANMLPLRADIAQAQARARVQASLSQGHGGGGGLAATNVSAAVCAAAATAGCGAASGQQSQQQEQERLLAKQAKQARQRILERYTGQWQRTAAEGGAGVSRPHMTQVVTKEMCRKRTIMFRDSQVVSKTGAKYTLVPKETPEQIRATSVNLAWIKRKRKSGRAGEGKIQ